ncbi:MAG: hypothetical protein SOV16_00880 [Anaerobiospirillum succiniciproducens]|uniref:hypothetical protein n=1 Tax=Anaerobiospirillum succiniciproducens TaxID=13335 RepID=UPI002A756BB5|nr:hypothetical protein [Anaerobiospirillum succiniciproducens]MDY2797729.1 hypothetical protein [Anaerobiospirillum succiniciproducens]
MPDDAHSSTSDRFYISSLPFNTETLNQIKFSILDYWSIESSHHGPLDNKRLFDQDSIQSCNENYLGNSITLNKLAYNFLSYRRAKILNFSKFRTKTSNILPKIFFPARRDSFDSTSKTDSHLPIATSQLMMPCASAITPVTGYQFALGNMLKISVQSYDNIIMNIALNIAHDMSTNRTNNYSILSMVSLVISLNKKRAKASGL